MSIDRLAAKIAAIPKNKRGRRRYPDSLKREIMTALPASGMSNKDFAAKIGVSHANLCYWRDSQPPPTKRASTGGFKAISVETEATPATGICLRGPGGVVIEGLSLAAAAELIAALSGRSSC